MAKSMTGFGQARGKIRGRRVSIELKSVNHKYCEVNLRLPSRYFILEPRIAELTKNYFQRGRIDIFVRDEGFSGNEGPVRIDRKKLKEFFRELKGAAKALDLESTIDINTLLAFPHMFLVEEEEDLEKYWVGLRPLIKAALDALDKMRLKEGGGISLFLSNQLKILGQEIQKIEKDIPGTLSNHQNQLQERLNKLTKDIPLDTNRLAQEIAHFVDRTDVSEEVQRFKAHREHFIRLIKSKQPLGRKLDFLLQEMMREVNTLSAKIQDAEISQRVVEIKHALERMREQVQNLE
jgi:uncharacterized protein (TIGR00255 family)